MDQVPSYRIGSALIPIVAMFGLFSRQNFDKTFPESVKPIGILYMPVKGCRVELAEKVNAIVTRIEAIADRYVDQPVLASKRDGRFATQFGQWI